MPSFSETIPATAQRIINELNLFPHPSEGGFFFETHRSSGSLLINGQQRSLSTAIYFLVVRDFPTELHHLPGDELFHFYLGDPLELFLFDEEKGAEIKMLGVDLEQGMRPQILIPGNFWQAARVKKGGSYSLVGTTMTPGFDYSDYQALTRQEWKKKYPSGEEAVNKFYGM